MKQDEAVADIGAVLLVILLIFGVTEGLWSLTSVLVYGPYFIILGIIALLGWGYRERIEALRQKLSQKKPEVRQESELVSESEKLNFRNSLFEEIRAILENLLGERVLVSRIRHPIWISKTDAEKCRLLGEVGYASLSQFYKTIDEANTVTEDNSVEAQIDLVLDGKSRRRIIEDTERIFEEVDWLKERKHEVQALLDRLKLDLTANR
jgi:hypothetical protein